MKRYERGWWWFKEKKHMALVVITITMILQLHGCVGCLETERIGLLQLKSYLNSLIPSPQEENILKSWSDDSGNRDCCLWEGLNCSNAIGGHIVHLSLDNLMPNTDTPCPLNLSLLHSFPQLETFSFAWNSINHFFNPIHGFKSFQRLKKLRTLDLSGNDLDNSVLPFLSAARTLRTLNLGFSDLEGVFPPNDFANMTELRVLNLHRNRFSSVSIQGLINLRELEVLDLSDNRITDFESGDGYKSFQRLEKLRTLDLSYNCLNNSVLSFISAAKSLRTLNLSNNVLEGVFPPNELANMTKLRVLNLRYNRFISFSIQGLINLVEMEVLDLYANRIADIEAGDGLTTTKLKTLDLSGNNFSNAAQLKGLENLVELKVLSLESNNFNHTLYIQVLKDMPKLQELDLSYNEFTDLDSLGVVFPSSLQVLKLRWNQLSLTPEGYSKICALVILRELDLNGNALTNMPYCLGNLSRLRTLDLSDNQLNGNLSSFVSGLPSTLEYLSLVDNNFNSSFLFSSLVNQTRLSVFKLSSKVGMIQARAESSWAPLFQLKILKLQNFILGSTIPGFLVHQRDLLYVDLSHNKLIGAIPTWLVENNTRLQTLLLNSNSLTKFELPRLVHGLQALDLSGNEIQSSIQEDIGIVFPKLRYMNFSSNHFHGTIPSSMGEMKSLETLDVSSNGLSGQLPTTFLSGCYSLGFMKLSNNQFQGQILSVHANLTGLDWLFLDGNNFSGSLGKGLLKSKNLIVLDISDNRISGTLPLWIGRMSIVRYLYMKGNQLEGPFPHQLQNLSGLEVMDISHNSFSGSIPSNVNFSSLRELRLQNNEYMGSVPSNLFKAEELEVLDLRNNNFSGMMLNTNDILPNLRVLLLRNNSFRSQIPEKICQLSKVGILDLSHNKFKGVIPSCLGNMSFGAEKYGLFGTPVYSRNWRSTPFLQNWRYTSALDLDDGVSEAYQVKPVTFVDFVTKNRYETYQGDILRYMYGLDLSSNELSGEIPIEIGNLESIRSLNFSSNHFTGSIPDSISKLKDLESLDLSNNKLNGNIPPQLADLNSLGYFNVSCNNLSDEIPLKGHLLTFGGMSYIGNAHLCGPPTNKSCNPVPEPSASKQAIEEEEEEGDGVIDMVWFSWTCGAVYISTLLALFVFLCIDSRWSHEWFYQVDLLIHHLQRFKDRFVST